MIYFNESKLVFYFFKSEFVVTMIIQRFHQNQICWDMKSKSGTVLRKLRHLLPGLALVSTTPKLSNMWCCQFFSGLPLKSTALLLAPFRCYIPACKISGVECELSWWKRDTELENFSIPVRTKIAEKLVER